MALGKTRKYAKEFETPKLQITSMMDMFTIILIFLLFSFSPKPETLHVSKNLSLPESDSPQDYQENIKLVLSQTDLQLEGDVIAQVKDGKIVGLNPHKLKESGLYRQLALYREKANTAQKPENQQTGEGENPKEHILFLCDKHLPFKTINTIIKTAAMAGYPNFQFAVLKK